MCVLLIEYGLSSKRPIILAANRDENLGRASSGPEVRVLRGRRILAPRDDLAGGTWEGVNDAGVVVVITNRSDGDYVASRPSRGLLVDIALQYDSAARIREFLDQEIQERRYNSFNLFFADAENAFISSWNGALTHLPLQPGRHALSNAHAPGVLQLPEWQNLSQGESWSRIRGIMTDLLASHEPRDGSDYRICKHGRHYGTVSSSWMVLSGGTWEFSYAEGPACQTEIPKARFTLPTQRRPRP